MPNVEGMIVPVFMISARAPVLVPVMSTARLYVVPSVEIVPLLFSTNTPLPMTPRTAESSTEEISPELVT